MAAATSAQLNEETCPVPGEFFAQLYRSSPPDAVEIAKSLSEKRISKSRTRGPIYVQEMAPAKETIHGLSFSSGTPITVDVLGDFTEANPLARKYHPSVLRRAHRRRFNRLLRLNSKIANAVILGLLSAALYGFLFTHEWEVLEMSVGHSWSYLVPASIALVFSFVHGSFTGAFWDTVGMKPNTVSE